MKCSKSPKIGTRKEVARSGKKEQGARRGSKEQGASSEEQEEGTRTPTLSREQEASSTPRPPPTSKWRRATKMGTGKEGARSKKQEAERIPTTPTTSCPNHSDLLLGVLNRRNPDPQISIHSEL